VWQQVPLQTAWQNAAWLRWTRGRPLILLTRPRPASLRPRCAASAEPCAGLILLRLTLMFHSPSCFFFAPPRAPHAGRPTCLSSCYSHLCAVPLSPAVDDLQRRQGFHVIQPPPRNRSSKWLRNLLSIPSSRTLSRIWTHLTAVVATGLLSRSERERARARARKDVGRHLCLTPDIEVDSVPYLPPHAHLSQSRVDRQRLVYLDALPRWGSPRSSSCFSNKLSL
jgi:hypothetical protein